MSIVNREDEKQKNSEVIVLVKQHLPVAVVAVLGIWGYVDLKADIAGLWSAGKTDIAEQAPAGEPPEDQADAPPVPLAIEEQPPAGPKMEWECAGSIEHDKVIETAGKYGQGVFDCYRAALMTDPRLTGTLAIDINVGVDGTVREARVRGKPQEPAFLDCIGASVHTWQFSSPLGGDCAVVSLPFMLKPEDHLENAAPAQTGEHPSLTPAVPPAE